jgi:glyoxylase-like metal-dependent hydrolase (beta-lactamase superfamily II)
MNENKKLRFSREIYPDIYEITLPLPMKNPGPVNVYLFTGNKITLLDTGILQTSSLLKRALQELGLDFSDIEQVIVTHGHIDHSGSAKKIVKNSRGKATVAAHKEDVMRLEKGEGALVISYAKFLGLMGVPVKFRFLSVFIIAAFSLLSRKCKVDRKLLDGETIHMGNYQGTVIDTPGHTQGHICIYLEKEKILFSGDHILPHITPNAFVMIDHQSPLPSRLSQKEYFNSITKIESLNPSIIYPAHGTPIGNLREITDMYRRFYNDRQNLILSILDDGEQGAYQIARKLFPEIRGIMTPLEIFLALSEVYTHLQVLMIDNLVSGYKKKGKFVFKKN